MNFLDWLFSTYPNPHKNGEWGALHITVLTLSIAFIVISSILFKNKSKGGKYLTLCIMAGILIFFGLTRRVVGFIKMTDYSTHNVLYTLLPRPGCAISCWLVVIAVLINKKFFYNFASIISILCGVIFFAYPGAGFLNEYILFENLYSIITHAVFFIMSFCFITYGFTDFKYNTIYKEGICFAILLVYTFLEIYLLKINSDPFYFMPGNEVMKILGMDYSLYLPLFLVFIVVYLNAYYLIPNYLVPMLKKSKNNQ